MNTYKIGQILSEAEVCQTLGITIPKLTRTTREATIKQVANFQMKKSFAVSAYNKSLKAAGLKYRLSQSSHTNYKVVPLKTK